MLGNPEREQIARLWARKVAQDAQGLAQSLRRRNLEPATAEFLCAEGIRAKRILEIGGSSGLSTIALAVWGLAQYVEFVLAEAAAILPSVGEMEFASIDCEKDDYVHFFDMLHLSPGGVVVADNIISHSMTEYVNHVRARPRLRSLTLPIGKGIELTRFAAP